MPDTDAVLRLNGADYSGWTNLGINISLTQLAGTFSLGVTEKYPGAQASYDFKLGSACQVLLNGQTVITGYVETISPSYSKGQHGITLSGRDLTGDLVDCAHLGDTQQWLGQSLTQIAKDLLKPFNIPLVMETEPGENFLDARYSQGDSVLDFLNGLCSQRNVLPYSKGDGKLTLGSVGAIRSAGTLEMGGNILSGSAEYSSKDRYSSYIAKGQSGGGGPSADVWAKMVADDSGEEYLEQVADKVISPSGTATDEAVKRYRPMVVLMGNKTDAQSCQKMADFEATSRAGAGSRASVTVQGWTHQGGKLWAINTLVPIKDDNLGLNKNLLIESVNFSLDETNGSQTVLSLVDPRAYVAEPQTAKDIGGLLMISFEALKQIKRLLAPISRRINGLVSRAMIRAVNAEGVNLTLLAGEQTGLMPLLQEFGLASTPPPGAQAIALFINGDRSHGHVIATDDARYRPRDIESGMAALYSLLDGLGVGEELSEGMSEGQAMHSVRLKPGRVVEINGTSAQIIMNGTPLNITAAGGS